MHPFPAAASARPAFFPASLRLFRRAGTSRQIFVSYPAPVLPYSAVLNVRVGQKAAPRTHWARQAAGVMVIGAFILLTWLRAESLMHMMPQLVDLGLGVLAGIIGNSLGYWFGLLGVAPTPACTASQTLKMVQIVGVPVAYVLLGGHMLLMPVVGAVVAAALVLLTRRFGWACRSATGH